eukprot:TRINITY_DN11741_c0_g5_i1.p1 TRINITY_DN11741_c0_g5~~TRINITY_DN11741_c0_g5_i1.p1  ORF type:complete len:204 (+),score=41.17 TRINITY_DN11741_c0_g5_i1:480-1091(+)
MGYLFALLDKEFYSQFTLLFLRLFYVLLDHTENIQSIESVVFLPQLIQIMWNLFIDGKEEPLVPYGLGLLALKFPGHVEKFLRATNVIDFLLDFTKKDILKERLSTKRLFDNCVGALGRILKSFPTLKNIQKILPQYISLLPLKVNQYDNPHQFQILIDILTRDNLPKEYLSCPNLLFLLQNISKYNESLQKPASILLKKMNS